MRRAHSHPNLDMEFFARLRALGNDTACPLGYFICTRQSRDPECDWIPPWHENKLF
ncbi:MAG: hypothetical protein GY862_01655 [Gammaproteobacteria bacterium]|nr:hypothetical protein [Gammaproteobacteria bacterium]